MFDWRLAMPAVLLAAVLAAHAPRDPRTRPIPLPEPTGPYQVGTVTRFWVDDARPEPLTAAPDDLHQLAVQFWYPAQVAPGAHTARYVPYLELMLHAVRADNREGLRQLAANMERYGRVVTSSYPDAELAPSDEPLPVLVMSPGGHMSRHWHTTLMQEWASHGYVVVAMSHAYSGWDVFPAGGLLVSHPRWHPGSTATPEERERVDQELSNYLAADARFVLDKLEELNTGEEGDRFRGRLDLDRVALLGHSRGGKTESRTCSTDSRPRACVIFDNVGPRPERYEGLMQPFLSMRASGWPEERVATVRRYLNASWVAYEMVIEGASHFSFSDLPIVDPDNYATKIGAERALEIISAYTLAFLDRHLSGGEGSLLDGPSPDYPEVQTASFVGQHH